MCKVELEGVYVDRLRQVVNNRVEIKLWGSAQRLEGDGVAANFSGGVMVFPYNQLLGLGALGGRLWAYFWLLCLPLQPTKPLLQDGSLFCLLPRPHRYYCIIILLERY